MARQWKRTWIHSIWFYPWRCAGDVYHDQADFKTMKAHITPIASALVLFIATGIAVQSSLISMEIGAWSYGYIGVFTLIVLFFHNQLIQSKNTKSFITLFLGAIAAKMFITLIYLTIALYTHKDWEMNEKLQLAMSVFIAYLVFTVVLSRAKPSQN
jgi:uncharacterized membrane protein YjjP (DUF1212 family)